MMRCVLLGTSTFAIPTAGVLTQNPAYDFLGVIAKPDEPAGRQRIIASPPLAKWAIGNNIRLWQPATKKELSELIKELRPDFAVVAAYGKIIPSEALTIPRHGFINIHPSLLPKHRGPSPIQAAIANGDAETGVTLMLVDARVDHGPILAQERAPLSPTATRTSLETELAKRGAALLERMLPDYFAGRLDPRPQNDAQATTTPLLTRDHGRLDWRQPATALERKVRAYEGWPGTWCTLPDGRHLKVINVAVSEPTDAPPGTILRNNKMLRIACGENTSLNLNRVQPEGGAVMTGAAFLRGFRNSDVWPLPA